MNSEVAKKLIELGYEVTPYFAQKAQYENDNPDYPTGNVAVVNFTEDGLVESIDIIKSETASEELYDEFEEEIVMDEFHLGMANLKI